MGKKKGLIRKKYICELKGKDEWKDILDAIFCSDYYVSGTLFEIKQKSNPKRLKIGYGELKKMIPYIEHITSTLDYKANKKALIIRDIYEGMLDSISSKSINKI